MDAKQGGGAALSSVFWHRCQIQENGVEFTAMQRLNRRITD